MIGGILFTILFAISGMLISEVVFAKHKHRNRLWLGLAIGLMMLTWLPCLFAFMIGFSKTAQFLAAIVSVVAALFCAVLRFVWNRRDFRRPSFCRRDWLCLIVIIPIAALCTVLLDTHILKTHSDGSVWVGQVTYGDLAMHLGFITSIAEQSAFPPQYSIFPGHALNYPFLCETSGASLLQIGTSVRDAYLITAVYACILVVTGVYAFFEQWLKRKPRAALATILFFFGGGFGFFYFFDLSKSGGTIASMLSANGQTVSELLLDGFYQTPTNIPALGLRWVNPIVDMMIPQRATLFGWAFLFPCLYLLHGFAFENKKENVIPLAVIAGLLPMIHTHSFLALGVISAVYCISDLIAARFNRRRLIQWLAYAVIACALAMPQLFLFTFRQTTESGMVRFHLNWGNETDSYLWFYIKNLGLIFLLMPFAFFVLPKRDRKIYSGAIALWIIAELIEFQPNDYDNNKLLFIWFAFTCGMVAKFLSVIRHRIVGRMLTKCSQQNAAYSYSVCIAVLNALILLYYLFKVIRDSKTGFLMQPGTALTVFFSAGLLLALCIGALRRVYPDKRHAFALLLPTAFSVWLIVSLTHIWLKQYTETAYCTSDWYPVLTIIIGTASLAAQIRDLVAAGRNQNRRRFLGVPIAVSAASFLLLFTMTISSALTIAREWKSEYQVYTESEVRLSEQIRNETEPDAVILANSYHWNLVTPLTGRSIVTGTGTFLHFHGIDTSERERDVRLMYTDPQNHADLFAKYGVRYVLISNAERGYEIDYTYFNTHGEVVAKTDAGYLLRISQ